jgi:hypothetical protein
MTLFFGLLLLSVAWQLKTTQTKPQLKLDKQKTALNFNNKFLQIFSLGQSRLISSSLWITTLLESDLEHVNEDTKNSWMFLRFNSISQLDPYFLKNYQFGGQYLSIIKDDIPGAEIIMKKGLQFFPTDYKLNFNLGFLLAIESNRYTEAVYYFEKVVNHPKAPKNIQTLLAKIRYMGSSDTETTISILSEILDDTDNEQIKIKIEKDIYSLTAERDLECLNTGGSQCNRIDFFGDSYILYKDKFESKTTFKKYKLNINRATQ